MDKLTARQHEMLRLLADGIPPKEIALRLDVSRRTVYARLKDAQYRTGCESLLEIAVKAAAQGKGEA